MLRLRLICVLITIIILLLPGCASPEDEEIEEATAGKIPVDTEFGRMLGFVPYSFLEEHDIWFGDLGKAKQLYGFEDINSYEVFENMSDEEQLSYVEATRRIYMPTIKGRRMQTQWVPVFGFEPMMANRAVFVEIPPPGLFSINEGDFDEDLIKAKLVELGYEEKEHGSFTYYSIFGDYDLHMESEVTKLAMSSMNRVAVLDDTIINTPTTEIITGILDATAGDEVSVIDNIPCRALAASMGDVLSAVVTTPDRILDPFAGHGEMPPFDFTIPDNWGLLHQYDAVAMGYKDDGEDRFWVISLYYTDSVAASADAEELMKRMGNYIFNRQFGPPEPEITLYLKDVFEVSEPAVRQFTGGATLTVECRCIEARSGSWLMPVDSRDLLFLAPDPSLYVEE